MCVKFFIENLIFDHYPLPLKNFVPMNGFKFSKFSRVLYQIDFLKS